jgi:hypothetical protein
MRTAGLPSFRKLWGRIPGGLEAKEYKLTIHNRYVVSEFGGQKHFVLSQTNALGGKNVFLGIFYIVVGVLCLLLALAFCGKHLKGDS